MPVNASPEYAHAEKRYLNADTDDEKILALEEMMRVMPKHKSAENLRAQLRRRYKDLIEKKEKKKSSGKHRTIGIKKEDMQVVILGKTNSGKSYLINSLTNVRTPTATSINSRFTTTHPIVGIMPYSSVNFQIIENPAIESEFYDKGLTNSADTIILLMTDLNEIKDFDDLLLRSQGKKIIVINKIDSLTEEQKRKLSANLQSKRYDFVLISTYTGEGIEDLKEKIFKTFSKIRVYTKEPGKEKSPKPIILQQNSTVQDVAEKILKGFSNKVKETRIWGPSSKFPGQVIGLQHKLVDGDVVEFKTK